MNSILTILTFLFFYSSIGFTTTQASTVLINDNHFFASTENSSLVAKRYWSKVSATNNGGSNKRTVAYWGAPKACSGEIGPSQQFSLIDGKYYPICTQSSLRKGPSFDTDVIDKGLSMHQIYTEAAVENSTTAFIFPYDNLGQTGQGTNAHLTATYVDLNPTWAMKPWGNSTADNSNIAKRAIFIARQKISKVKLADPQNTQLQQVVSFGFLNTACFNNEAIRNESPTVCQFQINLKTFNKGKYAFTPLSNSALYSDEAQGSIAVILGPIGPAGFSTRFDDGQVAWTSYGDEMQIEATNTNKKFQIEITWDEALGLFQKLSHNNPDKYFGPSWNVGKDWVLINAQYGHEVFKDPAVATPASIEGYFQDLEVLSISEAAQTCSYTYSAFEPCQSNNTQKRSVLTSAPANCTGGNPITTQACTYVPPTTCNKGTFQSGNKTYEYLCGCGVIAGGILQSNGCYHLEVKTTPSICSSFTYSAFESCQSNSTQKRSVLSSAPVNCTGGNPITTQACTYVPPTTCNKGTFQSGNKTYEYLCGCGVIAGGILQSNGCYHLEVKTTPSICSSFTYSAFETCQSNNTQKRSVLSSAPANCTGGNPITTQACTYVPPTTCNKGTFQSGNKTYEYLCGCGVIAGGILQANGCYHRAVP